MMKLWNKISIHPLTYILLLISLLSGLVKYVIIISLIVIIHELGHVISIMIFKREIEKVMILPFGGLLKVSSLISSDIYEDLIIAISGIAIQLVFGVLIYILFKINYLNYMLYTNIRFYNSIIIAFNLLPLCPLDGAKIIKLISEMIIPYKKTFVSSFIISLCILISLILIKASLIYDNLLVFLFIITSTFIEFKRKDFYLIRFYLERLNKNFKFKKTSYIEKLDDMYKNRNHIINGLDEKEYLKRYFM